MVCDHSCTSGVCQELNPQARIYKLRGLTRLPTTKPPPRVIIYKLEVNGTWIFTTQVNTSFYKFFIPNLSPSQLTISLVKLKDHKITTLPLTFHHKSTPYHKIVTSQICLQVSGLSSLSLLHNQTTANFTSITQVLLFSSLYL